MIVGNMQVYFLLAVRIIIFLLAVIAFGIFIDWLENRNKNKRG